MKIKLSSLYGKIGYIKEDEVCTNCYTRKGSKESIEHGDPLCDDCLSVFIEEKEDN